MKNNFILHHGTNILIDGGASKPLEKAVSILKRDMDAAFWASELTANTVVIRVLEQATGAPAPETFLVSFRDSDKMIIEAGDSLGAVYGLLYLSGAYLGVSPFWFWNNQSLEKRGHVEYIEIPTEPFASKPFFFKHRGWFINDEILIDHWDKTQEADIWEIAFETLLRCGGNMVIPGTDLNSRRNRGKASDMGLRITHHHAEPLGAEMFSRVYPGIPPVFNRQEDLFLKLWEDAILEQKDTNTIWNLGFRGQGDKAFWDDDPTLQSPEERSRLLNKIIWKQYDMVKKYLPDASFCTNLYGEVMELYRDGLLDFPEDVIKIWADNGFGRMVSRRQNNHNPRVYALPGLNDRGPHGLYYHVSFHDLQASNHLTMLPNSPGFVLRQLEDALECGAGDFMIVNCGNIKPHAYFLDLISRFWTGGECREDVHKAEYIKQYFEGGWASIEACLDEYFDCTVSFGKEEDERAGEQFYNYSARYLITGVMKGESYKPVEELLWVAGEAGLHEQAARIKAMCGEKIDKWEKLTARCFEAVGELTEKDRQLFEEWLLLQTVIHESGCKGLYYVCSAIEMLNAGRYEKAFVLAHRAGREFERGLEQIQKAEAARWKGFYDNDCFSNIKLTVYCMDAFVKYIRVIGDGPYFYKWEKEFLTPKSESSISLLSNKENHLSDDELAARL